MLNPSPLPLLCAWALLLLSCAGPPPLPSPPQPPQIEALTLSWALDPEAPPPIQLSLNLNLDAPTPWLPLDAPPTLRLEGARREGDGWRFDPPLAAGAVTLKGALAPPEGLRVEGEAGARYLVFLPPRSWLPAARQIRLEIKTPPEQQLLISHPAAAETGIDITQGPLALAVGPFEPVEGAAGLWTLPGEDDRAMTAARWLPQLQAALKIPSITLLAIPGGQGGAGALWLIDADLLLVDEATATPQRRAWSAELVAITLARARFKNVPPAGLLRYLARALTRAAPEGQRLDVARAGGEVNALAAQPEAPALDDPLAFEAIAAQSDAAAVLNAALACAEEGGACALDALINAHTGLPLGESLQVTHVPLLEVELDCPAHALRLTRRPYAFAPMPATPLRPLPVCFRYALKDQPAIRQCLVLTEATRVLSLSGCPAWLHPNADQRGRYLWSAPIQPLLAHLDALTARERAALGPSLEAAAMIGALAPKAALEALEAMGKAGAPDLLSSVLDALPALARVCPSQGRAGLKAWARRTLGAPFKGPEPPRLRARRLLALAWLGADEALFARAQAAVEAALANPNAPLDPDADALWPIAAWRGDAALWRRIRAQLEAAPPLRRAHLLRALSSFQDPDLVRQTLDLLLDGALQPHELRTIIRGVEAPQARAAARAWVLGRQGSLKALPLEARVGLAWLCDDLCDDLPQARRYLDGLAPLLPAEAAASMTQAALARLSRCQRARAALAAPLSAALEIAPPSP
ncbi:ERAP1-like C-terminal domain-containing protein [Myxococcota bacterium]|nr:ERAP1-like C-terminal domain-containing protein [Myxococcota bacterium]MBU1899700.1 ERAP1-like C-terminal domain-containing protein [Myxococcota bacterium]